VTTLRTLKKLLLGETWILPVGVAVTLAGGAALRALAGDVWQDVGGLVMLAGVLAVLGASVQASVRRR
jgi:hypothetical protein